MNPATINAGTFTVVGPGGPVAGVVARSKLASPVQRSAPGCGKYFQTTSRRVLGFNGDIHSRRRPPSQHYIYRHNYHRGLGSRRYRSRCELCMDVYHRAATVRRFHCASKSGNRCSRQHAHLRNFQRSYESCHLTNATFTLTGPGATPVVGLVTYSGSTATFTPTAVLANGTLFTATITTGAKDPTGAPLWPPILYGPSRQLRRPPSFLPFPQTSRPLFP